MGLSLAVSALTVMATSAWFGLLLVALVVQVEGWRPASRQRLEPQVLATCLAMFGLSIVLDVVRLSTDFGLVGLGILVLAVVLRFVAAAALGRAIRASK